MPLYIYKIHGHETLRDSATGGLHLYCTSNISHAHAVYRLWSRFYMFCTSMQTRVQSSGLQFTMRSFDESWLSKHCSLLLCAVCKRIFLLESVYLACAGEILCFLVTNLLEWLVWFLCTQLCIYGPLNRVNLRSDANFTNRLWWG